MAALKKYDPKEVIFTWRGIALNDGIVDGTFIIAARTSRNASMNVGSDGKATMVINNDRTGTVTLVLRAGSNTNNTLSDINGIDESGLGQKSVGMLQVQDFSGNTLMTDEEAFIDGPPDVEFANEEGENTWTFMCPDLTIFAGSSNLAAETSP